MTSIIEALPGSKRIITETGSKFVSNVDKKIRQAGIEALAEVGFCFALDGLVSSFVKSHYEIAAIFASTGLQNILNNNFQKIGNLFWNCLGHKTTLIKKTFNLNLEPDLFYIGTAYRGSALIHELGHFLASKAVYENSNPRIELFWQGGLTSYRPNNINDFGRRLGEKNARALVTAAGPIFTGLSASSALIAARLLKTKYPKISKYLNSLANYDFVGMTLYSLEDLIYPSGRSHFFREEKLTGDFARLHELGIIHPLAAAVGFAALPILINKGMDALEYFFGKPSALPVHKSQPAPIEKVKICPDKIETKKIHQTIKTYRDQKVQNSSPSTEISEIYILRGKISSYHPTFRGCRLILKDGSEFNLRADNLFRKKSWQPGDLVDIARNRSRLSPFEYRIRNRNRGIKTSANLVFSPYAHLYKNLALFWGGEV